MRGLARARGQENHRVAGLDRAERKMAGDLLTQVKPVRFLEEKQTRRQRRRLLLVRLADEHHIELEPVGVLDVLQFALIAQHGAGDGIGAAGQLTLLARLKGFLLTTRKARLPVAEPERGVLPRLVHRPRKIGTDAQDHEVRMRLAHPAHGGVVFRSPQFRDFFGTHPRPSDW